MSARILVVDDQPEDRRLLAAMLEPYGYEIRTASSGEEALEVAASDPPDMILLDVVMGGMSGYDACRELRADERTRVVPIVMLTASPEQDKVAGLEAGADDFVMKPFDRHELLARVRSLLRIKSYHDTVARQAAELAELNRTLEMRVAAQVAEILSLRGLGGTARFQREGEFWTIAFDGSAFRLRDTKGLHYIGALLREPGRERYALDLETAHAGGDERGAPVAGDAGPILDPEAKAQYRARLDDLANEIQSAEEQNDTERAARATEEREALVHELAAAVGLGGRDRRAGSDAERARVNVTRAIRAALERIQEHSRALGQHLDATLRTGQFCAYVPDPRSPIRWEL
jgi:CheY-like chemotaxis protein